MCRYQNDEVFAEFPQISPCCLGSRGGAAPCAFRDLCSAPRDAPSFQTVYPASLVPTGSETSLQIATVPRAQPIQLSVVSMVLGLPAVALCDQIPRTCREFAEPEIDLDGFWTHDVYVHGCRGSGL